MRTMSAKLCFSLTKSSRKLKNTRNAAQKILDRLSAQIALHSRGSAPRFWWGRSQWAFHTSHLRGSHHFVLLKGQLSIDTQNWYVHYPCRRWHRQFFQLFYLQFRSNKGGYVSSLCNTFLSRFLVPDDDVSLYILYPQLPISVANKFMSILNETDYDFL